ncbi:hypothetical protein KP509_17G030200 [Ceratopteris richardii]|nr:hypothetical protein KP509_17G030200 [Ceratopteris richardii]
MLTEDAFTLLPGHYMQEIFGSCKAMVFNHGTEAKKFYRDMVTIEFQDIIYECLHFNAHPGALLNGNYIFYMLTYSGRR